MSVIMNADERRAIMIAGMMRKRNNLNEHRFYRGGKLWINDLYVKSWG